MQEGEEGADDREAVGGCVKPYYQDSACTIYHGDCQEILPTLPKVDLVLTDPPYGVGLSGKVAKHRGKNNTKKRGDSYTRFDDSPEYIREVVLPVIRAALFIHQRAALTPGARLMWEYPKPDDIGCFFSAAGTGLAKWGFCCFQPILFYGKCPYLAMGRGSRPNSLGQTYPNDANRIDHPCAKPMAQWKWLVNRASLEGGTILDPFMGSGTTLVAAKNLGRKAIGIEIEEKYCEIAAKRLAQEVLNFGAVGE